MTNSDPPAIRPTTSGASPETQLLATLRSLVVRPIGFLLIGLLMAACSVSNEVLLQIDSNPKGAKIFKEGKFVGDAPIVVSHQLTEEDKRRGFFMLMPLSARWLSGAEYHSKGMSIPLADGAFQNLQFQRPLGAPGEVVDANYGIELLKLGAMNAQAESANRQAAMMRGELMRKILSE